MSKADDPLEQFHSPDAIDASLRRVYEESGGWTPVYDRTPLHEILEAEEDPELERRAGQGAIDEEDVREIRAAAFVEGQRKLLRFLFGQGPRHAFTRLLCAAWKIERDLLGPMGLEHIGAMVNKGKAAMSATIKSMFDEPMRAQGRRPILAPGQKPEESRAAYAENASRHKPRQGLNGSGGIDGEVIEHDRAQVRAEASARLEAQKLAHGKRELEEFTRRTRASARALSEERERELTRKPAKQKPKSK